jgi:hypothetical protein
MIKCQKLRAYVVFLPLQFLRNSATSLDSTWNQTEWLCELRTGMLRQGKNCSVPLYLCGEDSVSLW